MADFGVTDAGFTLKGLDVILKQALDRAQQMFGSSVDLTESSALTKILQVTALEDAELWKRMEDLYYSNFASTAVGASLDLLGDDLGLDRRQLFAQGQVKFTIKNAAPRRNYILPEGTIVVTDAPVKAFFTLAAVTLTATEDQATVTVQAVERGTGGNVGANQIKKVDDDYATFHLSLGGATLQVENALALGGGERKEGDEDYRVRLLGLPRNIWTLESIRRAVLDVDGVTDVLLFDLLGGVDVGQNYFNMFRFNERLLLSERRVGQPYFFDIVVAHEFGRQWESSQTVTGIRDRVSAAADRVTPVGIRANIIQADHVEVGVQGQVIIEPGYDGQALLATIQAGLANEIGILKLGGSVLYSQVIRAFVDQPGVADVQNLRLRRCPPAFGRITFGGVPFQSAIIELGPGENLVMGSREIAVFQPGSELNDLTVAVR